MQSSHMIHPIHANSIGGLAAAGALRWRPTNYTHTHQQILEAVHSAHQLAINQAKLARWPRGAAQLFMTQRHKN